MTSAHEELESVQEQLEGIERVTMATKRFALVFAVMAMLFTMSEVLSRSAQATFVQMNTKASDLWTFYQAKSTTRALTGTIIRIVEADVQAASAQATREEKEKLLAELRQLYDRYESDPDTREGRRELMAQTQEAEYDRDRATARLDDYQLASTAFQLGMWLAFVGIITGVSTLGFLSGGLGFCGVIIIALGLFAPEVLIH